MKTSITLKVEADLLRESRIIAAEEGSSVSSLLSAQLESLVRARNGYDQARRRALARLDRALNWARPASRDELHAR
jgi:hypothetical protein